GVKRTSTSSSRSCRSSGESVLQKKLSSTPPIGATTPWSGSSPGKALAGVAGFQASGGSLARFHSTPIETTAAEESCTRTPTGTPPEDPTAGGTTASITGGSLPMPSVSSPPLIGGPPGRRATRCTPEWKLDVPSSVAKSQVRKDSWAGRLTSLPVTPG